MKALGKLKRERGIEMYDAPIPEIGPNDLLIKVLKTCICGTDVHIYEWDEWAQKTIPVPMTVGHEFMGIVEKVGAEVSHIKVGDRVSGEGHVVCETCRNCREGRQHHCPNTLGVGIHRTGCFAEFLSIPAKNACIIPKEISDEIASILDPLGNAVHTTLAFDIIGEDVLITGAGPIGIMAAAVARHVGARNVVITDINKERLELAKKIEGIYTVHVPTEDLSQVMKSLGINDGFEVGLEMSGSPAALNQMVDALNHGGKIALLGIIPDDAGAAWTKIVFKSLTMKGIYGREMYATWHKMLNLLQNGLNIDPIITHNFGVDDYKEAFETMCSGKCGKVIIDWTVKPKQVIDTKEAALAGS